MNSHEKVLTAAIVVIAIAVCALFLRDFFGFWRPLAPEIPVAVAPVIERIPPEPEIKNPHADKITHIEQQAGMPLSRIARLIIRDEGIRNLPYLDSEGKVTIGVGRSLETNGISTVELFAMFPDIDARYVMESTSVQHGRIRIDSLVVAQYIFSKPLSEHDIELLLTNDLKNVKIEAVSVFGSEWNKIDSVRQEAVLDVLYNLGLPHFKTFVNFIEAVKQQNWKTAAAELLRSEAARENIRRYHRSASVIESGDPTYFELR